MEGNSELIEKVEACRTCGVFYLTASNFLRRIFHNIADDPEMVFIRLELLAWNIEINENDGFPQFICTCCIHEFQKIFKFKRLCIDMQSQWQHFYNLRQENIVRIKKEKIDPSEEPIALVQKENICDFIYVDDLSDGEFDGTSSVTPFNIPHIPIKEELVEATVSNVVSQNTSGVAEKSMQTIEEPKKALEVLNLNGTLNNRSIPQTVKEHNHDDGSFTSIFRESLTKVQCNLCLHMSSTHEQHQHHMQRIHGVKDLECYICGKTFRQSTASRLKFHLKWHRLSKHIKCAQCGFFCDSRSTLKEHTRAMHTKIECNICGKKIHGKKMKIHMRSHRLKPWSCSYCKYVFDVESDLERHIWQIHAQEEPAHDSLEKATGSREFKGHILNRDANEIYQISNNSGMHFDQIYKTTEKCEIGIPCLTAGIIKQERCESSHLQSEHFQYNDDVDMNSDVFQSAITKQQLSISTIDSCSQGVIDEEFTHIISSDEEETKSQAGTFNAENPKSIQNQFACPKCTETFSSTDELCTHYQNHFEKSNFRCEFCGKMFDLKFSLNRHLKKHKESLKTSNKII